jgi:pSer/pThr/pTyr-binding forkhead associated (FHA) protein
MLSGKGGDGFSVSDTLLVQPLKQSTGKLTVLPDDNTQEQVFPLYEGVAIIGRKSTHPSPATTISIRTADRSMSREHLRIEVKKEARGGYKHYLSDNNSKNHTLYNSNYLEEGEVVILNNNDEIVIGHTILRFNE